MGLILDFFYSSISIKPIETCMTSSCNIIMLCRRYIVNPALNSIHCSFFPDSVMFISIQVTVHFGENCRELQDETRRRGFQTYLCVSLQTW